MEEENYMLVHTMVDPIRGIRVEYGQAESGAGRVMSYEGSSLVPFDYVVDMTLNPGLSKRDLVTKLDEARSDAALTGERNATQSIRTF